MGDITSTNARAVLTVEKLFPAGLPLQNFSTDQSVTQDEETFGETRMGVDGKLAAGYTPTPKKVTISFEADSPSLAGMEQLIGMQKTLKKPFKCGLVVMLPSISRTHTYTNGYLISGKPLPDGKKVLDPVSYTFEFEDRKVSVL
jgi:hypothetical protein